MPFLCFHNIFSIWSNTKVEREKEYQKEKKSEEHGTNKFDIRGFFQEDTT